LDANILPIRLVVVKVIAFLDCHQCGLTPGAVAKTCLQNHQLVNEVTASMERPAPWVKMPERLMLRDVKMRWNLTFAMLEFAVTYHKLLDLLSSEGGNRLREFELKEDEWKLAVQLHDCLKVCMCPIVTPLSDFPTDIPGCDIVFLSRHSQSRYCDICN
jgi:hypothetical protein